MSRLFILATIILSILSYASAQYVDTLNTPIGPVTQGAKVAVTWTLLPNVDASAANGDLSATDSATKNVVEIDPAVPLGPKTYLWNVQVPPGTYTLGLNDGSGLKQSGEVTVKAPAGGPAPAPGAPGAPGAPAPPADGKTAPAPAPPASGKTAPAPAPADGGKAGPAPAPSASGATPSTPATPAGGNAVAATTTPPAISTGSASSFGYDVVLGLLSVAVAMLQF